MQEITFTKLYKLFRLDNMNNWDTVLAIDGSDHSRHGPVGVGKSAIGVQFVVVLHPDATIARNIVLKKDIEQFERLLKARRKFVPIMLDEAEWFFYKRHSMRGEQKERILHYMTNRKEAKFHIWCLPRIWDLDIDVLNERVQWRLRIEARGIATLWSRNSPEFWNKDRDVWGHYEATFSNICLPPSYMWNEHEPLGEYHRCIEAFIPAVRDYKGRIKEPAVRAREKWVEWEENALQVAHSGKLLGDNTKGGIT